jgi:hypothetical protein
MQMTKIETATRVTVGGQEVASVVKALAVSAKVSIVNVRQVGAHILGEIDLNIDFGFGSVDFTLPFDVDTGVANPITIDLGSVSIPVIGDVEVLAEFSYDLAARQICAALTLAGLITVAKTCAHF